MFEKNKNKIKVTDYGDENPLLMDYFGFSPEFYELKFSSRGDATFSRRVLELFHQVPYLSPPLPHTFLTIHRTRSPQAGVRARLTGPNEARGMDGRGFQGPGLDHGVFIPFRLMFGEEFRSVPIVQASIDSSLSPESNWNLGKAIAKLRCVCRFFFFFGSSSVYLASPCYFATGMKASWSCQAVWPSTTCKIELASFRKPPTPSYGSSMTPFLRLFRSLMLASFTQTELSVALLTALF